jgi:hypothetical protein
MLAAFCRQAEGQSHGKAKMVCHTALLDAVEWREKRLGDKIVHGQHHAQQSKFTDDVMFGIQIAS